MAAEELPCLIASLSADEARQLEDAARVGRDIRVTLKWGPVEQGPHLLEVYLPNKPMPINFLAEPLEIGDGSEGENVPLRVYPWEEEEALVPAVMPEVEIPEVPQDRFVGRSFARGRFEIISPLGEGSIGAVYRARHTGLGITVALKVLHEAFQHDREFGKRFHAEALALSQLDHPNLIHIQDFGEDPDEHLLYISMAFLEGDSLRGIQKKQPKKLFELPRIVNLMAQVCAGLGHAHERGLIHRDVKPDNVMVVAREDDDGNKSEVVKVLDFGFAVSQKVSGEVAQRLAGTPVYMSPEQCLGQELDGRSDVYACGIMVFEFVTGTVPFLARDAETIRKMHVRTPAPAPSQYRPDIDPRVDRIVAKALAKRREDRYASMQELRAELRQLLVKEAPRAIPVAPPVPPPRVPPPPPPRRSTSRSVPKPVVKELPAWARAVRNAADFEELAHRLIDMGGHIRPLAAESDVASLHAIATILDGVADRAHIDDGSWAAHNAVASVFTEPAVLGPIAARLLVWDEADRDAAYDLVIRGGGAGVYALWGARTKIAADANARIAFVRTMKAFGEVALPVVRAALERILERALNGENQAAAELAEDVLLSVPPVLDDATGRLVEQYATSPASTICRAAARALPRVWAERAAATLMKLLDHTDEAVLAAAMAGLRESNTVDARVVRKLGMLADRGKLKNPQLKAVAVAALGAAMPSAKPDAAQVIEQLR